MSRLTFIKLAEKIINEEKKPLTPMEIWELARRKDYVGQMETQGKTPWQTIGARLYIDIRDNRNSIFVKIKSKPVKFFLKSLGSEMELSKLQNVEGVKVDKPIMLNYLERDIHPFLNYYLYTYLRVNAKTLLHEKSGKKKFSQWLHPDMVGAYFPIGDWQDDVLDFSKEIGSSAIKLYSFEIKRELGFHNLRESFFQAVSNSSWANEGYLVTTIIDTDEEFQFELKRLSTSFGIGIILIDLDEPDSTAIIYPSRFKSDLDWENINKLAEENPDFKDFIRRIKIDFTTKEIRKELYDRVIEPEQLVYSIRNKK